jgi:hypothetical protein
MRIEGGRMKTEMGIAELRAEVLLRDMQIDSLKENIKELEVIIKGYQHKDREWFKKEDR